MTIGATARQDLCAAPTEWTVLCSPHTAEYLTFWKQYPVKIKWYDFKKS